MELRYTEQIFSEKDTCLVGDWISLRNVEVYILARIVISRVDLYCFWNGPLPAVLTRAVISINTAY